MKPELRNMLDSLLYYLDCKAELDKCLESCDHSAGYFCHRYYERVEKAGDDLEAAFDAAVEATIAAKAGDR